MKKEVLKKMEDRIKELDELGELIGVDQELEEMSKNAREHEEKLKKGEMEENTVEDVLGSPGPIFVYKK